MKTSPRRSRFRQRLPGAQRGSFLLEALISVLIVAFGVLGLIGLQARAIQNVDDAQYRGEASYLANGLLGQMWTYDKRNKPSTLATDLAAYYTGSGAGYTEFKAVVDQRLPGATISTNAPFVKVDPGPTDNSANVVIRVFWQPPGEASQHKIEVFGTVGFNSL